MTKSKSWQVEHAFDDDLGETDSTDNKSVNKELDPEVEISDQLETPEERKARKRSHWVAYTTMFVMSIGFSIVLSGVWPYLQNLTSLDPDSNIDKSSLGWVVAANPFGQMVASPLLGLWGNKAGSIRGACIVTVICFIGGNMMYACLYAFVQYGSDVTYYMMILSRFIVGVSSANITLCRSYVAGSTTLKERTTGIAIIAAAQALGFVVGPGIQAVLVVVVKETSYAPNVPGLVWDKYTSAGWVAAILGFINLVVVMPCIFQEYSIAEKEQKQATSKLAENVKLPKPDYIAVAGILFAFFFDLFIYVLLETLAEPFVQDQYATTEDFAMVAVGVALMGGGTLSTGMYAVTSYLAKKYEERKLLILLGMVPTVIGTFLYIPWGDAKIQMQECDSYNYTVSSTTTALPEALDFIGTGVREYHYYDPYYRGMLRSDIMTYENCTLGCPIEQTWCNDVPMLPVAQLIVAFAITIGAFPVIQALCQTIFSKILGPKPQGLWMGILTGTGSLARVTGPIFVSYVYTYHGTYLTFGILEVGMILALIELIIMYPRLVPMKMPVFEEKKGYDNKLDDVE